MELKPFLTYEQQVAKLRDDHGLWVPNTASALQCLKLVNYYYLRGYYIHWMDRSQERFLPGVSFEDIWELYQSDRAMRALLYEPLSSIELKVRCAVAYILGQEYGQLGYLDASNFWHAGHHAEFLCELDRQLEASKEPFVAHHRERYYNQFPVWVAIEVMTMGMVSKLLGNMLREDQTKVADLLGLAAGKTAERFVHAASHLRNVCAHHGRLYSRPLNVQCRVLTGDQRALKTLEPAFVPSENSLFAVILAARAMLPLQDHQAMAAGIGDVFAKNPKYEPARVGFPDCWEVVLASRAHNPSKIPRP